MNYLCELKGGPYDGIIILLNEKFSEILQPRGDAAKKPVDQNEIEFNMSLYGEPFSDGVTYERYELSDGETSASISIDVFDDTTSNCVIIYRYTGIVGRGEDSNGIVFI